MSEPDPFKINEAVIDLWRCYIIERDMAKELEAENARLKAECQARQAENSVLAVECDSLKAEVERLTAFTTRTIIPNEELQAQVERLIKAGDAMATTYEIEGWTADSDYTNWNAAKEGKQP